MVPRFQQTVHTRKHFCFLYVSFIWEMKNGKLCVFKAYILELHLFSLSFRVVKLPFMFQPVVQVY